MMKAYIPLTAITLYALSINTQAAQETHVWMKSSRMLQAVHIQLAPKNILQTSPVLSHQAYNLHAISSFNPHEDHQRFELTYHDLPIWGKQLILHYQTDETRLSGSIITGIENDLASLTPLLSEEQATSPILQQETQAIKLKQTQLMIYLDEHQKAHLAYLLKYLRHYENNVSYPHFIIDANDAHVFEHWEGAHALEGSGPGGNTTQLPYRSGAFQYGHTDPNLPSLGTFPMTKSFLKCYTETPTHRVINLENESIPSYKVYKIFPILDEEEQELSLTSMSGFCWPWTSVYVNQDDQGFAPVNGGYSPVNDALYFVQATLNLYQSLGIQNPLGTEDLPIRVYTHIGGFDNAFALPTFYSKDHTSILAHQQIVLSNGQNYFTTTTQSIIAHELSHNFTDLNSQLNYKHQSGGINESFSDMAAMAMMDAIAQNYPFYWDQQDWSLGRESTLSGKPLRYMDHPSQDGKSIEHMSQYNDHQDVHWTSGIFNRAFYLLSTSQGWSIQKAFQVMADANMHYWEPESTFQHAACGVIQAAEDRHYETQAVLQAFDDVGVACDPSSAH